MSHEQDQDRGVQPSGHAPYSRTESPARRDVDHVRPWREAGRSWDAQADQLQRYYRAHGTVGDRLRDAFFVYGHPEVEELKGRARAARRIGRRLDTLTPGGWAVLHDRRVSGTEESVDHVLIGPDGITVVQSVKSSGTVPDLPYPVSVHDARSRLNQVVPFLEQAVSPLLPGWAVTIYAIVAVDGAIPTVWETPQACAGKVVTRIVDAHPKVFSRTHVADLAVTLDGAFPYADLGTET